MWKLCALFAVVFVLHGVGALSLHHSSVLKPGPVVVEARAIATKPVVALTDHEVVTIAASLEGFFTNAGLTCPEGVKATMAFGMMMPRIPVSAMRLHQMIHGAQISEQMTADIMKLIGDVIGIYFAPVMKMPRFPEMVKVLNNKMASFGKIVDMIIKAPANPEKVTVGDVTQRIKALISNLKAVPCVAMIQAADMETFKAQVPVVQQLAKSAKVKDDVVNMVYMKVCQAMKNDAGCGAIAVKVVGAVHAILDVLIGNAKEIAMNLPTKLPIGIFLLNFVRLTRPQPVAGVHVAGAAPGIAGIPAAPGIAGGAGAVGAGVAPGHAGVGAGVPAAAVAPGIAGIPAGAGKPAGGIPAAGFAAGVAPGVAPGIAGVHAGVAPGIGGIPAAGVGAGIAPGSAGVTPGIAGVAGGAAGGAGIAPGHAGVGAGGVAAGAVPGHVGAGVAPGVAAGVVPGAGVGGVAPGLAGVGGAAGVAPGLAGVGAAGVAPGHAGVGVAAGVGGVAGGVGAGGAAGHAGVGAGGAAGHAGVGAGAAAGVAPGHAGVAPGRAGAAGVGAGGAAGVGAGVAPGHAGVAGGVAGGAGHAGVGVAAGVAPGHAGVGVAAGAAPGIPAGGVAAGVAPGAGAPGIAPGIPATSIAFPPTTDVCYRQKFFVYHAAVIRLLTNIRMMAIRTILASIIPAAGPITVGAGPFAAGPMAGVAAGAIIKDTMDKDMLAAHLKPVLLIVRKAAGDLIKDLVDLKHADKLAMAALVHPINKVLPRLAAAAICTAAPDVVKSVLLTTLKNIKLTIDGPVGGKAAQLSSILTEAQVKEFVAKVKPIEEEFKVAFDDLMVDFKTGVFSTRPLMAIITMVHKMDVGPAQITAAKSGLTVAHVIARYGVPSTALVFQVPVETLHMVIESLVDELEMMVPACCRKMVAVKFTEGWLKRIIVNKIRRTAVVALTLLKKDPTVNVNMNMGAVVKGLKVVLKNELGAIVMELDKIQGIKAVQKEVEGVLAVKKSAMDLTVGVVLQHMLAAAAHILPKSADQCVQPDLASWTAFINAVANRKNKIAVLVKPVVVEHFGHNQKAADIVLTAVSAMYEELAATLAQMATMQNLDIVREIFIEHLVEHLHMVPKPHHAIVRASMPAMAVGNMKAAEFFNSHIFINIRAKYAEILAGLLKGKLAKDLAVADILKVIDAVKAEIMAISKKNKRDVGDLDIENAISKEEGLNHLLDLLKQIKMSDLPGDVVANVIVAMAHDVQKAIPEACQLPLRVKFIAAVIQHITEELMKIGADHPVMAMLVPMFDGVKMPLATIEIVLKKILPVVHKIGIEAMKEVNIFAHTGPLKAIVEEVVKVKGDAKPVEVFATMKARLVAMIKTDPAICAPVDVTEFVMQAKGAFAKALKSPALARDNIHALIAGIPGVKADEVVTVLEQKVFPAMEQDAEECITHIFKAVHNPEYFPIVMSHIIVHIMEVKTTTPLYRLLESPVYELFVEKLNKRLMAEIVPLIPAPHTPAKIQNVVAICARAYIKTLHIVFGGFMKAEMDDIDMINVIDLD